MCIVTAALVTILITIGCAPTEIPPAAITEIYALSNTEELNKYVEVKQVDDRDDYCYIMIYIQSDSGEFTTLEDALPQAKRFSTTFAEAAVEILDGYEINKDLAVWAQLPLEEGGVTILGHVEYDGKRFQDFELYKP